METVEVRRVGIVIANGKASIGQGEDFIVPNELHLEEVSKRALTELVCRCMIDGVRVNIVPQESKFDTAQDENKFDIVLKHDDISYRVPVEIYKNKIALLGGTYTGGEKVNAANLMVKIINHCISKPPSTVDVSEALRRVGVDHLSVNFTRYGNFHVHMKDPEPPPFELRGTYIIRIRVNDDHEVSVSGIELEGGDGRSSYETHDTLESMIEDLRKKQRLLKEFSDKVAGLRVEKKFFGGVPLKRQRN